MLAEKIRPLLNEGRLGSKAESDDFKMRRFGPHALEATHEFAAYASLDRDAATIDATSARWRRGLNLSITAI